MSSGIGDRARALVELGDNTMQVPRGIGKAWNNLKQTLRDPVAVDGFVLACRTAAEAMLQLSNRAEQFASDLLDGEEED